MSSPTTPSALETYLAGRTDINPATKSSILALARAEDTALRDALENQAERTLPDGTFCFCDSYVAGLASPYNLTGSEHTTYCEGARAALQGRVRAEGFRWTPVGSLVEAVDKWRAENGK